jgi:hypothetical protein
MDPIQQRRQKLVDDIARAKDARYQDEMSDDYCYSNGKYDRHSRYIAELEAKLRDLDEGIETVRSDDLDWDPTNKRFSGYSEVVAGAFPRKIRVISHRTGASAMFVPVTEDDPLFDPDGWDGEQMIYRCTQPPNAKATDMVLILAHAY